MIKPERPVKPKKPKLLPPSPKLLKEYFVVSKNAGKLSLVQDSNFDSAQDEDFGDLSKESSVDLPTLIEFCKDNDLDPKYLSIETYNEDYDYTTLVVIYNEPLSKEDIDRKIKEHQIAQATAERDYLVKLKEYEEASVKFKTEMAQFKVWEATEKLKNLQKNI